MTGLVPAPWNTFWFTAHLDATAGGLEVVVGVLALVHKA